MNEESESPIPPEPPAEGRENRAGGDHGRESSESGGSREALDDLGRAVRRAWREGGADARRAARDTMPRAREEFAKGLHDLAWGIAYLTSFGATLAREITPESMTEGWDEGTRAGTKAARSFKERREANQGGATDEEKPTDGDPPGANDNVPVMV